MPLIAILTWLKSNWLLVVVVMVIACAGFGGYKMGSYVATNSCTSAMTAEYDADEKARADLQKSADDKSAAYEKDKAAAALLISNLKGTLQDVEKKNAAFASCHAGPDFMSLYARAAGSGVGGHGTGQPDGTLQ